MKEALYTQELDLLRRQGIDPDSKIENLFETYCETLSDTANERLDSADAVQINEILRLTRELIAENSLLFEIAYKLPNTDDLRHAVDLFFASNEGLHFVPIILYHLNRSIIENDNEMSTKFRQQMYTLKKKITESLKKIQLTETPDIELFNDRFLRKISAEAAKLLSLINKLKILPKIKQLDIHRIPLDDNPANPAHDFGLTIEEHLDPLSSEYLTQRHEIKEATDSGSHGVTKNIGNNTMLRLHAIRKTGDPHDITLEEEIYAKYPQIEQAVKNIANMLINAPNCDEEPAPAGKKYHGRYDLSIQIRNMTYKAYFDRLDRIKLNRLIRRPGNDN